MRPQCPSKTSDGIMFGGEQGVTVVNLLPRGTTVNSTAILKHYEVCMLGLVEYVPEETCLKRN